MIKLWKLYKQHGYWFALSIAVFNEVNILYINYVCTHWKECWEHYCFFCILSILLIYVLCSRLLKNIFFIFKILWSRSERFSLEKSLQQLLILRQGSSQNSNRETFVDHFVTQKILRLVNAFVRFKFISIKTVTWKSETFS